MRNNSVSWKEGMFLLPQHFQQQEDYFDQQLASGARISGPFDYGFRWLEIDSTAFEDWQFSVAKASGRTKNGTLFNFESGEVPRLDLSSCDDGAVRKQLEANEPVTVYLAFSVAKPNSANVSTGADNARYFEFEETAFDLHSARNDVSEFG
jgi:type VI secretion system protein ImpJ